MAIFEASPEAVKTLDSLKLVQLLKYLILAECRKTGIALRSASVPLQITVADGGEDGRVEWVGGNTSTDYFPARFSIFQSKAQNLTPARVSSEVLNKKKTDVSDAIKNVSAHGGAYVIFCSNPLVDGTKTKLIAAIKKAIKDVGSDPDKISHFEIYDANKIADWVNSHPSVALWLASLNRNRSLAGFITHEAWSRSKDVSGVPWVQSTTARYAQTQRSEPKSMGASESWTFKEAREACLAGLEAGTRKIRVVGPSGYGKSRFVFEMLKAEKELAQLSINGSTIYADYAVVGDEVLKVAFEIAEAGSYVTLVVDDCPDDIHRKLSQSADRTGSELRLLTLDVETRVLHEKGTITLRLEREQDKVIEAIAKSAAPDLDETGLQIISTLSNGFPQMAVLGAQHNADGRETILSSENLVDRVIWGNANKQEDAERILESLSLFEWVDLRRSEMGEAEVVGVSLAMTTPQRLIEVVSNLEKRGVIERRGHFIQVIPIPLAARLASARLRKLPSGELARFFSIAPDGLKSSLLSRLRWLDTTLEAQEFTRTLLRDDQLGNLAALNTDFGAKCFDRLVHLDPSRVMTTLDRIAAPLTDDQLASLVKGRTHLTWALERLCFREDTFDRAARLLLRLASTDTDNGSAANHFAQLFQLHLSGTQVPPARRLIILDEGLMSSSPLRRDICIKALGNMLKTDHFSRAGNLEDFGSASPLEDWVPKIWDEVWDFHRAGLSRLTDIIMTGGPDSLQAKMIVGSHIRSLLSALPFANVKKQIERIIGTIGVWPEAIEQVTKWLFFDARKSEKHLTLEVRAWFDDLMPLNLADRAMVLTNGWPAELHDPDSRYDRQGSGDHEYSMREAIKLAPAIAGDSQSLNRVLDYSVNSDAKGLYAFAEALAVAAPEPTVLFREALKRLDNALKPNVRFFSGLIAGANKRGVEFSRECVAEAIGSHVLKDHAIAMVGAGTLTPIDIQMVAALVERGDVAAWQTVNLSYGQRLIHLRAQDLMPLLRALRKIGSEGIWTELEIISIYLYGGKKPPAVLAKELKAVLLDKRLFDEAMGGQMDGHHLEEMVQLLIRHSEMDPPLTIALTHQLMRLTVPPGVKAFYKFDSSVRKILVRLIELFPSEVWSVLSNALATTPLGSRLYKLLQADRDDDGWLGPGLIFKLDPNLYLDWIRADAEVRAYKALTWLPIALSRADGVSEWHPAMASFVSEFGGQPHVLSRLAARLRPTSWSGSLAPYIEPLVPLVASWQSHPIAEVRLWAASMTDALRNSIDADYDDITEPYR